MSTYNRSVVAVTNRSLCTRPFLEQVERVCAFQPAALILREKDLDESAYEALAADVLAICKRHQVPCILHSFLDVAKRLGVKQIQLPLWKLEEAAADANRPLDSFSRIGASVHSVEDARRAGQLGASYLIAGHIFATGCKPGIPPRGLAFLREVCHAASVPVYAIGGISLDYAIGGISLDSEQIQSVLSCGAAGVCIMSGMMRL